MYRMNKWVLNSTKCLLVMFLLNVVTVSYALTVTTIRSEQVNLAQLQVKALDTVLERPQYERATTYFRLGEIYLTDPVTLEPYYNAIVGEKFIVDFVEIVFNPDTGTQTETVIDKVV